MLPTIVGWGEIAMCARCDYSFAGAATTAPATRRHVLKFAGAAAAGLALPGSGFAQKAPPKPENVVSPDAALKLLMAGNGRYVAGIARRHDFKNEREPLTQGQNPYAGILSCADSRIAPEYAFDTARGDVFVCRVAGNFANDDVIASFEYAIAVLNTPLLLVLGHKACGAVDAAIKSIKDGTTLPGRLPSLVSAIGPAVKAVADQPGNALDNAIRQNVVLNVEKLKNAAPIIDKAVAEKKVRIVGGVYNLDNGRVELLG
jgi:carbonic anhydrase